MIRIVDEPIFSMTRERHQNLLAEYTRWQANYVGSPSFEDWLKMQGMFYTTHQQENP